MPCGLLLWPPNPTQFPARPHLTTTPFGRHVAMVETNIPVGSHLAYVLQSLLIGCQDDAKKVEMTGAVWSIERGTG